MDPLLIGRAQDTIKDYQRKAGIYEAQSGQFQSAEITTLYKEIGVMHLNIAKHLQQVLEVRKTL